jgi:hypothetical protein
MDIAHYNKLPSKIDFQNEIYSMYVTSLLADKILVRSYLSDEFIAFISQDILDDIFIIRSLKTLYRDQPDFVEQLERTEQLMIDNKEIANRKRKNKLELLAIGKAHSMMAFLRKTFRTCLDNRMKHFKMMELLPFIQNKIWEINLSLNSLDENREDPYIPELTETLSTHEFILSLDAVVEEIFTFECYYAEDNNTSDFIKIPLWKFPIFADITYPHLIYTRDMLKTVLYEFNDKLKQLSGQLLQLQYVPENRAEIKRLCYDQLNGLQQPVQQAIDESIYLSRLINSTSVNSSLTFCLGITSIENIVNYFGKTEMVEPYVVTQINQQLGRQIDVKSTFIFSYILVK